MNVKKNTKGNAWIGLLLMLILVVTLGVSLSLEIINTLKQTKRSGQILVAQSLSEAGIERAIWKINNGEDYSGDTVPPLTLDTGQVDVTVVDSGTDTKIITAIGYVPQKTNYQAKRTVRAKLVTESGGERIAFNYAVQVGAGGLVMNSNAEVFGNVYSNGNITGYSNSRIHNDAYSVGTISAGSPVVNGTKYPGSSTVPLPEFDAEFWREKANINNDPYIGNYTLNSGHPTLGPKKIQGNFTMNSNADLTLSGPLYVTGNFTTNSNNDIYLHSDFGSSGTVILVEGDIALNSNTHFHSTSTNPKGHILLVSLSSSSSAITLNSNATGGVYYAVNGNATLNSNADIVAITAQKLTLNANAQLVYDQGLASADFSGGPGGSWVVQEWQIIY